MFGSVLTEAEAVVEIVEVGPKLRVLATEAAILQMLINLFDNALYWQTAVRTREPRIRILLDGERDVMVFADNGPGVQAGDAPYIFEPFYSGKGEAGKGLGLYIARQLGLRTGFQMHLLDRPQQDGLPGANFVVAFGDGEVNNVETAKP
ncbi:sensor histidine kinase [Cellulomonas hominis]